MKCFLILVYVVIVAAQEDYDEPFDPWTDKCEIMDPSWDNKTSPQPGPSPYRAVLDRQTIYPYQGVYFTITAPPPHTFQGFIVQARDDKTGEAVGEFDKHYTHLKVFNCFGRKENSVMHVENSKKTSVTMRWAPWADEEKSVTFFVTIAETVEPLTRYWVCQKTTTLKIVKPE